MKGTIIRGLFAIGLLLCVLSCPDEKEPETDDRKEPTKPSSWLVLGGEPGLSGAVNEALPVPFQLAATLDAGEGIGSSPVIWDNLLYVATYDGTVMSFRLDDTSVSWEWKTDDEFEASPLLIPDLSLIVVGGVSGSVYALDAVSGTERWRAATEGRIMGSANSFMQSGTGELSIVLGSYDNNLYGFDARNGTELWSYQTGNYVNGTPAIEADLTVFGGCDAKLYILDLSTGALRGFIDSGSYIAGSAALKNGVAYVGNYGGRFMAVDAGRASLLWEYSLPESNAGFAASPAVTQRYVVIGAKDSFVYCFDTQSGRFLWKYRMTDEIVSSPLTDGEHVCVVAADGEMAMLRLENGSLAAGYSLGADVKGSPAYASGLLAVAALDGKIYLFSGATGS